LASELSTTLLPAADLARIGEAVEFIRAHDSTRLLTEMLARLSAEERETTERYCTFSHTAILVFPPTLDGLADELRSYGLGVDGITPSVVVRERLSQRYGLPLARLQVGILRAPVPDSSGLECALEIFALATPTGTEFDAIASDERANGHESHTAFEVRAPDRTVLAGLRALVVDRALMSPDGGGYNGHEDSTVLYFRNPTHSTPVHRRLELISTGHYPELLDVHIRQSGRPAAQLLKLMTGAWTTQAIAAAAELTLADHLAAGPVPVPALAMSTGTEPGSLRRLLRYLASLGIVRIGDDQVELTELGTPLRGNAEHSLRPLAKLYGGPFYQSFAHLIHSVRTGGDSFAHHFGTNHFDYFAADPELADLFDAAMASSAAVFGQVARVVDFSTARTVVDVAGGNGQLLGQVLAAAPHLRGVLLERPHAIEAARAVLAEARCADRCELVTGDFTAAIPAGGDMYLLSRVLHDWDDQQCLAILKRCAEAMPDHAELLIVERLLPEDDSPSLAVAWDLHMMCNVGGRERTATEYQELLADAGFDLTTWHDLPLDIALLRARRRTPAERPAPESPDNSGQRHPRLDEGLFAFEPGGATSRALDGASHSLLQDMTRAG